MNYLILLNRKFPFKSGEAFLENEIDEISKGFDKIIIYPSDVNIKDKETRIIKSKNVLTRVLEVDSLRKKQLKYIIKGIRYFFNGSEKSILKIGIEAYFLSASYTQANKIIQDLDKIKFQPSDTVYLYSYWLYVNAKVACLLKKYFFEKKIRCFAISRAHRFDIYEEKRKFSFLPQRKELLSDLNHIYACSNNGMEYLKTHYPEFADKITTSYLGTYDHGIGKINENSKFRIISCSRVSNIKRVNLIIEALKRLKDSDIPLEWTHLGGGDLYEKLKDDAKELSWMEVHLVGTISNTEVYNHYLTVPEDIFINVSSSEGLPVSIMEAISFGIPIIATDVGGTSEIVIDKVSGSLLPPNFTPEELAELIKSYAQMDRQMYRELRKSTRKFWEKHYQAPVNYSDFVKSIKELG